MDLGEEPAPEALAATDWPLVDWRLDRWLVGKIDFKVAMRNWGTRDPEQAYARAVAYAAEWDSLGLAGFLSLDPEHRAARRRAAGRLHRRARVAVLEPANNLWIAARDGMLPCTEVESDCPPPNGTDDAVTRAIDYLVDATGIDPSNPAAWYELAFLQGAVGDREREGRSLRATLAAVAAVPASRRGPQLDRLTRRVRLDLVWLARERGRHAAALAQLDTLATVPGLALPENAAERDEATLVRGLVHAERGEWIEAQALARRVLAVPVRQRNHRTQISVTATLYPPQRGAFNKVGWITVDSDFMNRWILARLDLAQGFPETAAHRLGEPFANLEYPQGLAHRYWQDTGQILAACGDAETARRCWDLAAFYTPLMIYFPKAGFRGHDRIHGLTGTGGRYFLGYDRFFLAGSLFGYAANLEQAWEVAAPGPGRAALGRQARTALDVCVARGLERGSALALRGRMRLLDGYHALARDDLLAAREALATEVPEVLLDLGVAQLLGEDDAAAAATLARHAALRPREAAGLNLLGVAQARTEDLDGALATLQTALDLDPDSGEIWYNRGLVLLNAGRFDDAHAHFTAALHRLPGEPRIRQMLEVASDVRAGRVDLAVRPDVVELPAAAKARLRGAVHRPALAPPAAVEGIGDWSREAREEMLARFEADYRRDPGDQTLRRLVWACLEAGRPERVQALLGLGWRDLDDDLLVLLLRADRDLGEPQRALQLAANLQTAPDLRPDGELWATVAATCLETEHVQLARRALARARELDPQNAGLRRQADWLETGS